MGADRPRARDRATLWGHLAERSVGDLLHRLGCRRISVRPRCPEQSIEAQEADKKLSRSGRCRHPGACARQADRAVVARRGPRRPARHADTGWAERGSRPRAPRHQRYDWAYLFGAVCPARDVGAALVVPVANGETMNLHLAEISRNVTP